MVRPIRNVLLFGLVCLMISVIPVAYGDEELTADQVQISTPVYHPNFSEIDFPRGTYNYTVSWQGIPAADATASIEQEGLKYRLGIQARTYSGIDILYKLRYNAQSLISAVDFSPYKTIIDQQENSKLKNTQITFLDNGEINAIRTTVGKDTKSITFTPNNFTLEPFSAAFLARSLDWKLGDTIELDAFNGKSRYLVKLTAVDKIKAKINDQDRDVWVISPKVTNLTSPEQTNKLREARIYVTADKAREILKIESEVFIGTVTTELVSYSPSTNPAPGTSVVQDTRAVKMVF